MSELLNQVGLGLLSGLFIAGSGYLKSKHEEFDAFKFSKTIVLGALVGGLAAGTGLQQDVVSQVLVNMGVVAGLENLLKALFRKRR